MNLEMLRDEYDLARRYTQSLYADLPEADVYWRPAPKSSGIVIGNTAHMRVPQRAFTLIVLLLLALAGLLAGWTGLQGLYRG
jgi:hypothetical protein